MTLILHPGPPGDAGPSAIDWALMGDDGSQPDASLALQDCLSEQRFAQGQSNPRSQWGVTCLQAEDKFVRESLPRPFDPQRLG